MLSRVGIHLLSVCLSTGFKNPFSQLFLNPEIYVDGYIVTMPPDLAAVVQKLLGAALWLCPNGHPYYIGMCEDFFSETHEISLKILIINYEN